MKVLVKVPATTANLGPGFDALGLALNLWNEAFFTQVDQGDVQIRITGEGKSKLPTDADNMIAKSAMWIFDRVGRPCAGLKIECINRVPLGSGMGSSSAAMLTGMLGANGLLGNPFSDEEILKLAIDTEGHPDNVAPAMLGGLVVSIVHGERVISKKLPARANHGSIYATVALPDFDFPTREARALLPERVERSDSIFNISRAVLVTEALRTGDVETLGIAMKDRLHQPYRLPLIPGAIEALKAGKEAGAAAVALSGAGPGLIAFSSEIDKRIGKVMREAFVTAGLSARIFELETSYEGAEVSII